MFAALAGLSIRLWHHQRSEPARWVAATFSSIAAVGVLGLVLPQTIDHALGPTNPLHWTYKILVAVLFLFPWFLIRFLSALDPLPSRLTRLTTALAIVIVVATFALPRIPATHDHRRPAWLALYTILFGIEWGTLSLLCTFRFWKAGKNQPSVARRRMHILALASATLVIALLPGVQRGNSDPASASHLASQIIGIAAALLFWIGFNPPGLLRAWWRRPEEEALRRAEISLMGSVSTAAVSSALLPEVARIFGGTSALLLDHAGEVLGSHHMTGAEIDRLRPQLVAVRPGAPPLLVDRRFVVLGLVSGYLAVETGPYTPFFGREESDLLTNLAAFVELALARSDLFQRERDARLALQRAHDELESVVYSFSHDLKSPLISIVGYVDFLHMDHADQLGDTGRHYLDRMRASAVYMSDLIQGLLDLSRIGRTQTEPEDVDLAGLVHDIADGARSLAPEAAIVAADLPFVRMNAVRARELFTNLIENALKHGRRADVTVEVRAERAGDELTILVKDDGCGIPAEYRERVFGIFERLDASTGPGSGTGVGLAICKKIVEQIDGSITVDGSESGTTFRITLPHTCVVRPLAGAGREA